MINQLGRADEYDGVSPFIIVDDNRARDILFTADRLPEAMEYAATIRAPRVWVYSPNPSGIPTLEALFIDGQHQRPVNPSMGGVPR